MRRLYEVHETRNIRLEFNDSGASGHVELSPMQRSLLIVLLEEWPDTMPDDLPELRDALIADLHE